MNKPEPDPRTVRESPIAGTWYPGSREELAETVDGFLANAEYYPTDDELIALISPHAGYPYSGQTAAYAYRQLQNRKYNLVILMGPSHYDDFGAVVTSNKQYYATPLGPVKLAVDFIEELSKKIAIAQVEQDREHSLEIQLPFLQRTLGDFKLVPLMLLVPFYVIGASALPLCEELANALVQLVRSRSGRVLFVASSDLSHLPDYDAVTRFDARTAELVRSLDIPALVDYMGRDQECRACGDAPIVTALLAAKALGANYARVFHRTNSGDVTGSRSRGQYTVGYMAAGVFKSKLS